MKFIISLLLMAGFSYAAGILFPWWIIALIVFLIALIIPQRPFTTFVCGFLALFILWAGLCFWISYNNGNILAGKISLLIFNTQSSLLLIIATGLAGGLVAGFAALAGSYVRYRPE